MDKLLTLLSQRRGIGLEYTDIWGKTSQTSTESKQAILSAMGYPLDDQDALQSMMAQEDDTFWRTPLDSVYVFRITSYNVCYTKLLRNRASEGALSGT